jgi:hypothetical protein
MSTGLQTASSPSASAIEQVLIGGDLSKLTTDQRLSYYKQVCESLGLNHFTKPFDYINLNGKLTLYAKRDCTDQLRSKRAVSIEILDRQQTGDLYIVRARAMMPDGRSDESLGAVMLGGLKGESLANAIMKCETKAKRRVTLSICGLGWLDETEVDSITSDQSPMQNARPALQAPQRKTATVDPRDPDDPMPEVVDQTTGELSEPEQRAVENGHSDDLKISDPQRRRMWALAKEAGWDDAEIKHFLADGYGIESTKDVPRRLYDEICAKFKEGTAK